MSASNNQVKNRIILAVDLGGTHLRAAVVSCDGKIHYRLKQPTPRAEKPDGIVDAIVEAAREGEFHTVDGGRISAVSVAVPGTVNFEEGVVVKAPNVPSLDGLDYPRPGERT